MGLFDRKPPPQSERTSEERERARAEREARRAQREGRAAEAAPRAEHPPAPAPRAERPPAPAPPPERPPAPAPPPSPAAVPPPPAPTPRAERPPPPAPRAEAPPATGRAAVEAPARPAVEPPAPDGDERPVRVRRAEPVDPPSVVFDDRVSEDWSALDADPRRRPLRARRRAAGAGRREPPAHAGPPGGAPRRWPLALVGAAVVGILVVTWLAVSLWQPLQGEGGDPVSVSIPRGAGISQAGEILAERGVVSSAFFFKLRARLEGAADVKPGTYRLPEGTSYGAALDALAKGPPPPPTTDITITEGRTIVEANRLLRRTSLEGSYAAAARRSTVLRPQQYGAPPSIRTKEGFLFPATYKVRVGAPVSQLVTKQLQTFRRQFATVDLGAARRRGLSPYEVLIVASMIEREAGVPKDRRLISSVIYNRLEQSIPLGIDATIRYQLDNWQRPLRMSELERDTPYNTRLRQGLPPTPIGNPGLASIRAAANPARTDFLYFVVKPCGRGEHVFTRTDAEFQRAAQRYEQARQARGGSPVDC